MKAVELRVMTDDELLAELDTVRREQFNLRFQKSTGRLADPGRLRTVRKDIARILTVAREREIWAEFESAQGEQPGAKKG